MLDFIDVPMIDSGRQNYRIRFPERERPHLYAGDLKFRVIDLSESGAQIEFGAVPPACFACPQTVRIRFRDGTEFNTVARYVRHSLTSLAVCFSEAVPLTVILKEQRRILRRYYFKD